jgi:hypothetical protein
LKKAQVAQVSAEKVSATEDAEVRSLLISSPLCRLAFRSFVASRMIILHTPCATSFLHQLLNLLSLATEEEMPTALTLFKMPLV